MEEKILDIATQLFLKFGYKSVTMDDLAGQLGVSKKTIYQSYLNKEVLIEASINYVCDQINKVIDEIKLENLNPIAELYKIRDTVNDLIPHEQAEVCLFQLHKFYPAIAERFQETQFGIVKLKIDDNLKRGVADGYYRNGFNLDVMARFYYLGIVNLTHTFFTEGYSIKELKDEFLDFYLHAIVTPKGKTQLETEK